jgi:hypothetical protein
MRPLSSTDNLRKYEKLLIGLVFLFLMAGIVQAETLYLPFTWNYDGDGSVYATDV